ncbi:MAG: glycosyl transferase, partial [Candidatus Nealsonbacteria bacterium]
MREENPSSIKKAKIVVGIPSFNEADSIAYVVKKVDEGLEKYFKNYQKVIINSDNNSPDGTGQVFLQTKTKTPKIYISPSSTICGKGNNLFNFFLKIKELGAEMAMTVDADLKSITPEWVKCLLGSVEKGYNFITPLYYRHKFDASITNHLCFPLIYGLLGYN